MQAHPRQPERAGFTLTEVLIAMAIMGLIAVFTIPKVLNVSSNREADDYRRRVKQVASIIQAAYQRYQADHNATAATSGSDLTPYMNYVSFDSTSTIDGFYGQGSRACASQACYKLANGATVDVTGLSFGNTNHTNALYFFVDPNGTGSATTNTPDKSTVLWLYFDGRIIDSDHKEPNTYTSWGNEGGPCPPATCQNPPYFNWN